LNNFNKNDVELLSYSNDFFKIKSKLNEIGYVRDYDIGIDEMFKYQAMFNEQDIISAKYQNKNLFIRGTSVTDINSAGGVSFSIDFGYFNSKKKIKYLYFTVVPYNNVGDMQICSVNRSSTFTGKITGPILAENKFDTSLWENAWYNNTITCIKITKVKVIYTDDSTYTYVKELNKILDNRFTNKCN